MAAHGVKIGQLDGAVRRIALTLAVIAGNRCQFQLAGDLDGPCQVPGWWQLPGKVAAFEQGEHRIDGLTRDVITGHAFAVPDGAGVEQAADHEVVGHLAFVGGMADALAQGNAHLVARQLDDSQRATSGRSFLPPF